MGETADEVSAVADAVLLHTWASQIWLVAKLGHSTRLSNKVPNEVLVDTGAGGGGGVTSLAFTKTEGHLHTKDSLSSTHAEDGFSE